MKRDLERGLRRGSQHDRTAQQQHGDGATTVPSIATVVNIKSSVGFNDPTTGSPPHHGTINIR